MSAPKRRKVPSAEVWKAGRFDCCVCRRDIRGETHLRHDGGDNSGETTLSLCTDCYQPNRDAAGVKWTPDTVRIIDTAATGRPLLSEDWLADQEVRLLDGILLYGFGNWRAVAEHMGGDKTEQMCEEHYEHFYLRSKCFPLPDLSGPPKPPLPPKESAKKDDKEAEAATTSNAPKEKRGASGMLLDASGCCAADLVGYMPLRGEYDTEWENEAELQICELEMPITDPPVQYARDIALLQAYNRTLDERQRRRDFVQKHDLIERAARHHGMDRRLSREERAFRTAMRPYAPHTTTDSHETLIKSTLRETSLRRRAMHLRGCATAGIRNIHEANTLWRQALAEEETTSHSGKGGASGGPSSRSHGSQSSGGSHHATTTGLGSDNTLGAGAASAPAGVSMLGSGPPASGGLASRQLPTAKKLAVQAAKASMTQQADPGGVSPLSLLSADESKACMAMGLAPSQYVACKRALIAEACARRGAPLGLADAQTLLAPKLDARRSQKFWQHCVRQGWVVGGA